MDLYGVPWTKLNSASGCVCACLGCENRYMNEEIINCAFVQKHSNDNLKQQWYFADLALGLGKRICKITNADTVLKKKVSRVKRKLRTRNVWSKQGTFLKHLESSLMLVYLVFPLICLSFFFFFFFLSFFFFSFPFSYLRSDDIQLCATWIIRVLYALRLREIYRVVKIYNRKGYYKLSKYYTTGNDWTSIIDFSWLLFPISSKLWYRIT